MKGNGLLFSVYSLYSRYIFLFQFGYICGSYPGRLIVEA